MMNGGGVPSMELFLATKDDVQAESDELFKLPRTLRLLVHDHLFSPKVLTILYQMNVLAHPPAERPDRLQALIDSLMHVLANEGPAGP
jgi:hypothetical protein